MEKRQEYPDLFKGVLIILVILGHCIQFGLGHDYSQKQQYFENDIYGMIYSFHMPAFMLISGYFFGVSSKKADTIRSVVCKRCKSTLIPIATWAVIAAVLSIITGETAVNIREISKTIAVNFFFNLWFLWAIIFCILLTCIWKFLLKENMIALGFFFFLFLVTSDSFNLHLYKFVFPFFLMGFLLCEKDLINGKRIDMFLKSAKGIIFLIFILVLWGLGVKKYGYEMYIYNTGISIVGKNIGQQMIINVWRMLIAAAGCYVHAVLIKLLEMFLNKYFDQAKRILLEFGKNSIGIYILSVVVLNKYILQNIETRFPFAVFLETIFVLIISTIVIKWSEKNRTLSRVLWGR